MAYDLFKSSDQITPFVIVAESDIDSTSTSIFLIGKRKEAYGSDQNQNFLWILENFANATPPSNAILGQAWFNTIDNKLYVCTDEDLQTFEKVSNPIVASVSPSLSLTQGNLWYDSGNSKLYVYNGATWDLIGPLSNVPLTVSETFYLNRLTSNATPAEMWASGITSTRLVIPSNTTWLFELTVVARRTNANGERRSWKFSGMLDNTAGTVTLDGSEQVNLAQSAGTSSYTVTVLADNSNKSLLVTVTGEAGKDISWNCLVKTTKISN